MNSETKTEIILECGVEGGSITILGTKDAAGLWRFFRERNESGLWDMLSEEDRQGVAFTERSSFVTTSEEALQLIDRYPWHEFYPLEVHPEFRERILAAVEVRGGSAERERWKIKLGR